MKQLGESSLVMSKNVSAKPSTMDTFCKHLKTVLFTDSWGRGTFVTFWFYCAVYTRSYLLTYLISYNRDGAHRPQQICQGSEASLPEAKKLFVCPNSSHSPHFVSTVLSKSKREQSLTLFPAKLTNLNQSRGQTLAKVGWTNWMYM